MQADQTVLSLRPGRGNRGLRPTIRLQRPHSAVPAASFKAGDEGHERVQYTRDQLLQLRQVIDAPEDILKIIEEIAVDVFGEDQSYGLGDASLQLGQSRSRYAEPDNRGRLYLIIN